MLKCKSKRRDKNENDYDVVENRQVCNVATESSDRILIVENIQRSAEEPHSLSTNRRSSADNRNLIEVIMQKWCWPLQRLCLFSIYCVMQNEA